MRSLVLALCLVACKSPAPEPIAEQAPATVPSAYGLPYVVARAGNTWKPVEAVATALSPDGQLAAADQREVVLLDPEAPDPVLSKRSLHSRITGRDGTTVELSFSGDGESLVAIPRALPVEAPTYWNPSSGALDRLDNPFQTANFQFMPGVYDHFVWRMSSSIPRSRSPFRRVSDDGRYVIAGWNGELAIWDREVDELRTRSLASGEKLVTVTPDVHTVVLWNEGQLQLVDLWTDTVQATWPWASLSSYGVLSPDGSHLALLGKTLTVLDLASGEVEWTLDRHVRTGIWQDDGLWVCCDLAQITDQGATVIEYEGFRGGLEHIATTDDEVQAMNAEGGWYRWRRDDQTFIEHPFMEALTNEVALSRDGSVLYTSEAGSGVVFDLATGVARRQDLGWMEADLRGLGLSADQADELRTISTCVPVPGQDAFVSNGLGRDGEYELVIYDLDGVEQKRLPVAYDHGVLVASTSSHAILQEGLQGGRLNRVSLDDGSVTSLDVYAKHVVAGGDRVVALDGDEQPQIFDGSGAWVGSLPHDVYRDLTITPDGAYVIANVGQDDWLGERRSVLQVYRTADLSFVRSVPLPFFLHGMTLSADGSRMAAPVWSLTATSEVLVYDVNALTSEPVRETR